MSSISAYCKARLLDGTLQPDFASLHTGFPGTTGANEVSGGAYARQGIVFSASSGDRRTQDGAEIFNVPASSTVRWIGHWQAGNWLYATPAGGASPRNFVSVAGTDTVYSPAHGWTDGQKVVVFNGTPPGGITEGDVLFVRDAESDSFKLAGTLGGSAIDMVSAPSAGCWVAAITEYEYPVAGTFTLQTSQIVIPD